MVVCNKVSRPHTFLSTTVSPKQCDLHYVMLQAVTFLSQAHSWLHPAYEIQMILVDIRA